VFLAVMVGGTGAAIVVTCLGTYAAALNFDAINADVLGYMASFYPAISAPLVIVLILCTACISAMGLYSGYQSVMTMLTSKGGSMSSVVSRAVVCGAIAVAGGVTALNVGENFLANISGLVTTLVYFLIPWSAINLTDFYLIRKGNYDVDAIVDRNGKYGLFNIKAMVVYAIGILAQVPFIVSEYPPFTGPFAEALGGLNFAWAVGFVVCAVLYWILERNSVDTPDHASTNPLSQES
jgi:NCS1 family nucleobase:cation symporter-1